MPSPTAPEPAVAAFDPDHLAAWTATQAGLARVPGVQYAVLVDGDVVLDGAWGVADVSTGEPLRTDHRFRVASHSKTFTATAIALLAEAGRLRFDDPFETHLPELAGAPAGRVTLREALGHTGGLLRDGRDADFWQLGAPFPDRAALLASVRGDGEVYGRGQHFKYSNLAYGLLGLVIEAVTGEEYAEHVRAAVVEPLGLADTTPEVDGAARDAVGHSALGADGDGRLPVAPVRTGALAAATGFCSTARDLVRWAAAHFAGAETGPDGGAWLRPETRRLLQRSESVVERPHSRRRDYGLGFESRELAGRRVVGHSGGFPGQLTRTWADPEGRVAVSVLTNAVDGPADALATGLFSLVATALDGADPAGADPRELGRWTGRFANLWGQTDLIRLGRAVWMIDPRAADPLAVPGDDLRPHPHAGFGPVGERIEVVRDPHDGRIGAIVVGGMTSWPLAEYEAQRRAHLDRLGG
jgi:CubicO group peptidase (beta-lactamase class C family)